mmetsp:Transcript_28190/g.43872  ORF Transcript_28190/g.43872 Transcript_28190/m.43872 type:complete len:155 (+) Transcript_28190:93-557(+)
MFLSLFIVNQSGGLVYHRPLSPLAPKIDTNDWLRIGSTFHSLHCLAAEAAPVRLPKNRNQRTGADDGIEVIDAGGMILQCLQTRTGMKFVITSTKTKEDCDLSDVLREVYLLYVDCALKNPFYELDMPIKVDLFNRGVDLLIEQYHSSGGSSRR